MQINPGQLIKYNYGKQNYYVIIEVKDNRARIYHIEDGLISPADLTFLRRYFLFL